MVFFGLVWFVLFCDIHSGEKQNQVFQQMAKNANRLGDHLVIYIVFIFNKIDLTSSADVGIVRCLW